MRCGACGAQAQHQAQFLLSQHEPLPVLSAGREQGCEVVWNKQDLPLEVVPSLGAESGPSRDLCPSLLGARKPTQKWQ